MCKIFPKPDVYGLTISEFKASLRYPVRGLWSGVFTEYDFTQAFLSALEVGFEKAWQEGASECGIAPDERKPEEDIVKWEMFYRNSTYIADFAAFIIENNRENGGKLGDVYQRLDLWVARYNEVVNRAKAMSCADQKLKWQLGWAEHCNSCLKLAGKVKRASQWQAADIYPKHSLLECGGFKCQCQLVVTDEPMSRGPLPSIP